MLQEILHQTRTVNVVDTTAPVFTSSTAFTVDENTTAVGTVTATNLQLTFTISGSDLAITADGVLTFITPLIMRVSPILSMLSERLWILLQQLQLLMHLAIQLHN